MGYEFAGREKGHKMKSEFLCDKYVCMCLHKKKSKCVNRIKFHLLNQLCYAASTHWLSAANSYSIHNQPLTHSGSQL